VKSLVVVGYDYYFGGEEILQEYKKRQNLYYTAIHEIVDKYIPED
jgi:hypothetical protein